MTSDQSRDRRTVGRRKRRRTRRANSLLDSPERRRILTWAVWGMSGLPGAVLATLTGWLLAVSSFPSRSEEWLDAGPAGDLDEAPRRLELNFRQRQGWFEEERRQIVFGRAVGDEITVLSGECSHLGCTVRWDEEAERFRCPCHGGEFSRDGTVTSGPPRAPLKRMSSRREGDRILVLRS